MKIFLLSLLSISFLASCSTDTPSIGGTNQAAASGEEGMVEKLGDAEQPLGPSLPAVTVQDAGARKEVWVIDAESKEKLKLVYSAPSLSMSAKMSSDRKWIIVTDQAFAELQRIHLLKAGSDYSFSKISRDRVDGPLWDKFAAQLDKSLIITSNKTTFEGWSQGGRVMRLKLAALPRGGEWIEKSYNVTLAGL